MSFQWAVVEYLFHYRLTFSYGLWIVHIKVDTSHIIIHASCVFFFSSLQLMVQGRYLQEIIQIVENKILFRFAEKDLVFLLDTKLNMRQKCAYTAKTDIILGCIQRTVDSKLKEMIFVLCSEMVRHWVLYPVLGSPVKERHGHPGKSP